MKFTRLMPNIFYADIKIGLGLFVECLEFTIVHDDLGSDEQPFCVIHKDNLGLLLIQSAEFAAKDRPELRLVTEDIEEVYNTIAAKHPQYLYPSQTQVTLKPWGAKEFALKDDSDVCVIIQQW